jgi:glycosyltransferase involved in cell wall biosynthesis
VDAPLVSCVVPVFNGARYLAEAVDSVLAQTHPRLELIVVDDGSTDGSAELAARYGSPVRLVRQPHLGLAAARNAGVESATGDFVAHLDADDLWVPDKLARQLARFQEHPGIGLSLALFQNFWVPELADEARRYEGHPLAQPMGGYAVSTLVTRRSLFGTVGLFDPREGLASDTLWCDRAVELGAAVDVLPEVLVRRRFHTANVSRQPGPERFEPFARFIKARLDSRRRQAPGADAPP